MDFYIKEAKPAVSVSLITYNHAPYIRECLDSLLDQETDFPYEICIGEDESTDGTREICQEYASHYPDKIRLILRSQSENGREAFRSQGVYNFIETCKDCRGKYQAICDGDDAWIDPLKLQKQYDIMEKDSSISLIHSNYDMLDVLNGRRMLNHIQVKSRNVSEGQDSATLRCRIMLREYSIVASSSFARTVDLLDIFKVNLNLFRELPMGDILVWCELLNYGLFHFMDESLVLYRILPESDSNSLSAKRRFEFINGAANLGVIYGEKLGLPMDGLRFDKVKNCNRYALLSGDREEIDQLYADSKFEFSFSEWLLYHAGRMKAFRPLTKRCYQMRYNLRNHGLNA